MIVKIEKKDNLNNCIGYFYYECEEIEYWSTNMKEAKESFEGEEYNWLIGFDHENRTKLYVTVLLLLSNNRNNIKRVITTRTCYILNNNGKTIDKLN